MVIEHFHSIGIAPPVLLHRRANESFFSGEMVDGTCNDSSRSSNLLALLNMSFSDI